MKEEIRHILLKNNEKSKEESAKEKAFTENDLCLVSELNSKTLAFLKESSLPKV